MYVYSVYMLAFLAVVEFLGFTHYGKILNDFLSELKYNMTC